MGKPVVVEIRGSGTPDPRTVFTNLLWNGWKDANVTTHDMAVALVSLVKVIRLVDEPWELLITFYRQYDPITEESYIAGFAVLMTQVGIFGMAKWRQKRA